jgi:tRNA(adenine34) deaminase
LANKNKLAFEIFSDEHWMKEALVEAKLAFELDEVPVGAIVVYQNHVIGRGHNLKEKHQHVTAHAELIAIEQASQHLQSWRLKGCTLYVTLEPCMMCTGALIQSRIDRIVFGVKDEKSGAIQSQLQLQKIPRLQHLPLIQSDILSSDSQALLKTYFQKKRHE